MGKASIPVNPQCTAAAAATWGDGTDVTTLKEAGW